MGTLILGWVEHRTCEGDYWRPVIDVGEILEQDYSQFGSLFGVRRSTGLVPVAPRRGLPEDVSDFVRDEATAWEGYHDPTWVSWEELEAVDWSEVGNRSLTRRQLLKEDGEQLLAMMEPLAARYGGNHVRLVVWFET